MNENLRDSIVAVATAFGIVGTIAAISVPIYLGVAESNQIAERIAKSCTDVGSTWIEGTSSSSAMCISAGTRIK